MNLFYEQESTCARSAQATAHTKERSKQPEECSCADLTWITNVRKFLVLGTSLVLVSEWYIALFKSHQSLTNHSSITHDTTNNTHPNATSTSLLCRTATSAKNTAFHPTTNCSVKIQHQHHTRPHRPAQCCITTSTPFSPLRNKQSCIENML